MGNLLVIILELAIQVLQIYTFIVLASVIFSWLVAFGVVNAYNPTVRSIYQAISTLTEPALRRIRRYLPDLGAVDISPIVLLLACWFLIRVIAEVLIPQVQALGL
ncbi:MAG: YggT family protein [Alphaproteobacteria bacterium]|nr:YggT family protein [Alphaproteobacteria bacterium]